MPEVVVWELEKDGFAANREAVEHCRDSINRAWRETAPEGDAGQTVRRAA